MEGLEKTAFGDGGFCKKNRMNYNFKINEIGVYND